MVPGSIGKKRDTLDYRFEIQRNGQKLTAFYTGVVPDTFKDDSEVVLTGRLTSEGFVATDDKAYDILRETAKILELDLGKMS